MTTLNNIGIMQGRLSPPENNHIQAFPISNWEKEFKYAEEINLDSIEWIYDAYSIGTNPIETDDGIERMINLSKRYKIDILSLCADYFMTNCFMIAGKVQEENINKFFWLLQQCRKTSIKRIILPFVDSSSLKLDDLCYILMEIMPESERLRIEIHVETDLHPKLCKDLLSRFSSRYLWINYDTGNSASLGYDISEEILCYGDKIGSVHIKDRKLDGGTVPLGTGDVDFKDVFAKLKEINYSGDFILQTARDGSEISNAMFNISFVKSYWV